MRRPSLEKFKYRWLKNRLEPPDEIDGEQAPDASLENVPPPSETRQPEHRRRRVQDDYDDDWWSHAQAPTRFREHRKRKIPDADTPEPHCSHSANEGPADDDWDYTVDDRE